MLDHPDWQFNFDFLYINIERLNRLLVIDSISVRPVIPSINVIRKTGVIMSSPNDLNTPCFDFDENPETTSTLPAYTYYDRDWFELVDMETSVTTACATIFR